MTKDNFRRRVFWAIVSERGSTMAEGHGDQGQGRAERLHQQPQVQSRENEPLAG